MPMTMPWGRIESDSYWLLFVVCFIAVASWESFRPRLKAVAPVARRWGRHGIVLIVTQIVVVGVCRVSPVVMALAVMHSRYGLLNKTWLPYPIRFISAVLVLDLVKYGLHRIHHAVALLWRVHYVHHSDPDFDVSTGGRAHPIEVTFLQGANLAAVALLAAPPAAVLTAELLSAAQTFFTHANASLPGWLEKPVRRVFVTPDMHRIHHSQEIDEQWTNYGDIFTLWDRLFRTYRDQPATGQENMVVGIKGAQNEGAIGLGFILFAPFRRMQEETAGETLKSAT